MSILCLAWLSPALAQTTKLGLIQSSVVLQDANAAAATATGTGATTSSTIAQGSGDTEKSDYDKLMDQRRLQRLNKLWSLYWNRERDNLSAADAKKVSAQMAEVNYPNISVETTSSAEVTAAMRKSISNLGHQLELEQATAVSTNDPDTAHFAAQNIEYLHGTVEHNLTEPTYWLNDTPEVQATLTKFGGAKVATSASR